MKVLVSGANGLLGSHIINALEQKNYHAIALVRKGSNIESLRNTNCNIVYGNITDPGHLIKATNNCDFVIHAAANTSQKGRTLASFIQPNINATRFVIEACKRNKVKRLVFIGTANCFGYGTKENPGTEKNPFLPWLKQSGYAYSKYLAQQMVLNEVHSKNIEAVLLNPTFIIGGNDVKPSSGQIFNHILGKRIAFYPPGGKNFVDAEMAAHGVVSAMEKGKNGECYLLAGENLSYREFFGLVKKINKQRTLLVAIPAFLLKGIGFLGKMAEILLKTPVSLHPANAKMLCAGNYYSAKKAEIDLDFKILPIQNSAEKALHWFKTQNYFKQK